MTHENAPETTLLDGPKGEALRMLVEGHKRVEVARALGIDPTTLRRWLRQPEMASALAAAQAESVEGARVRLGGLLDSALDAIESVLRDDGAPAAARLRAAELVLQRVGLDAPKTDAAPDQADVARVLAFMTWEAEHGRASTPND